MDAVWAALEGSGFGATIRNSVFLYPAANILHVLAVMGFFALVAAMDLSLLKVLRGTDPKDVIARLRPWALACLILIIATGIILFTPEATAIAANPAFRLKLMAIVLALANVAANEWAVRQAEPGSARATALLSLLLWPAVAALGRSIAYF
jgi:hypothetical protein